LLQLDAERARPVQEDSYRWRGELRLWDNEALMGWYRSTDGAVRSKGTMYLALHPHGTHAWGRWVGMNYDGLVITGWGAMRAPTTTPARSSKTSSTPREPPMEQIADVSITAESADWLADFTRSIVNDRLAACGNIVPSIRSIYRWEGAIEDDNEALVILHTRQSLVPAIIERANRDHPYDTPQVLAVSVTDANPAYRDWVLESTLAAEDTETSSSQLP
jgi:periplasmic divalent cation tolerance protein